MKVLDYETIISFGEYHLVVNLVPSPICDNDDLKIQVLDEAHPSEY